MWSRFGCVALLLGVFGGCFFDSRGLSVDPSDARAPLDGDVSPADAPATDASQLDSTIPTDGVVPETLPIDTKPPLDNKPPTDTTSPGDTISWPDQKQGPLFFDDFSKPSSLVPDGKATWTQQNGMYRQTACALSHSAIPGANWNDVAVSVKLRPDGTCGSYSNQVGLSVRVQSNGSCGNWNFYACVIDVDNDAIFICHLNNTCACTAWSKTTTGSINTGTWYNLKFIAVGNKLTCSLSGGGLSPVTINHTDSSTNANNSGSAGVLTAGVKVSFDDLKVEKAP
jgi:hypothetical protein